MRLCAKSSSRIKASLTDYRWDVCSTSVAAVGDERSLTRGAGRNESRQECHQNEHTQTREGAGEHFVIGIEVSGFRPRENEVMPYAAAQEI